MLFQQEEGLGFLVITGEGFSGWETGLFAKLEICECQGCVLGNLLEAVVYSLHYTAGYFSSHT